jgi:hypothetical protein
MRHDAARIDSRLAEWMARRLPTGTFVLVSKKRSKKIILREMNCDRKTPVLSGMRNKGPVRRSATS